MCGMCGKGKASLQWHLSNFAVAYKRAKRVYNGPVTMTSRIAGPLRLSQWARILLVRRARLFVVCAHGRHIITIIIINIIIYVYQTPGTTTL